MLQYSSNVKSIVIIPSFPEGPLCRLWTMIYDPNLHGRRGDRGRAGLANV
jgi:hypothetical protein